MRLCAIGAGVLSLVVVVTASVALAGASAQGTQAGAAGNGQIAFMRAADIYVMRPNGSGVRLLGRGVYPPRLAAFLGFAWSPDASRLALRAGGEILVMDADGSDLERLVGVRGWLSRPTWSPEGDRIAFLGHPLGRSRLGIWVMNADGSNLHRIATPRLNRMVFEGWGPFDVDWSSSGRLVFTAWEPGRPSLARCAMTPIYVMNADGSNLREITPRECRRWGEPHDPNPDWSPDGRRIAYVHDHDVWVMNADGSSPLRLTDNGSLEVGPDWSPDGRRIVFERLLSGGNLLSGGIWVMNADGTHVRKLTEGESPRWRPVAAP